MPTHTIRTRDALEGWSQDRGEVLHDDGLISHIYLYSTARTPRTYYLLHCRSLQSDAHHTAARLGQEIINN
jgi:hypothetical protein